MEVLVDRPCRGQCHAAPTELKKTGVRTLGTITMPPLAGLGLALDVCWNSRRSLIRARCRLKRTHSKCFAVSDSVVPCLAASEAPPTVVPRVLSVSICVYLRFRQN
jgi:hypothetical protein